MLVVSDTESLKTIHFFNGLSEEELGKTGGRPL